MELVTRALCHCIGNNKMEIPQHRLEITKSIKSLLQCYKKWKREVNPPKHLRHQVKQMRKNPVNHEWNLIVMPTCWSQEETYPYWLMMERVSRGCIDTKLQANESEKSITAIQYDNLYDGKSYTFVIQNALHV